MIIYHLNECIRNSSTHRTVWSLHYLHRVKNSSQREWHLSVSLCSRCGGPPPRFPFGGGHSFFSAAGLPDESLPSQRSWQKGVVLWDPISTGHSLQVDGSKVPLVGFNLGDLCRRGPLELAGISRANSPLFQSPSLQSCFFHFLIGINPREQSSFWSLFCGKPHVWLWVPGVSGRNNGLKWVLALGSPLADLH